MKDRSRKKEREREKKEIVERSNGEDKVETRRK